MSDVVTFGTKDLEVTEGLKLIIIGGITAIIGRLVFDIIRERVDDDDLSSNEKLTIDE